MFNFGCPPKSEKSHFQRQFVNFHVQHPNFHLALEPRILKIEGSSFGNNLCLKGMTYNNTPQKVPIIVTFRDPPPYKLVILRGRTDKG